MTPDFRSIMFENAQELGKTEANIQDNLAMKYSTTKTKKKTFEN